MKNESILKILQVEEKRDETPFNIRVPSFCDAISIHAEFILLAHVLLQIFLAR